MSRNSKQPRDPGLQASKLIKAVAPIPAPAAFSFLKQTRGLDTWTVGDLAKALHVPKAVAEQALSVLEIQGYVKPEGSAWATTLAGYSISGSKMPRLSRTSVLRSLRELANRIKTINGDSTAAYRITRAVAFGDFLDESLARVQPADVGVELAPCAGSNSFRSAPETKAESAFLQHLRGHGSLIHIIPFEEWMQRRLHQNLL